MNNVDQNVLESNWLKLTPAQKKRLEKLREKFEKLNL
jgi:hypothetical protein